MENMDDNGFDKRAKKEKINTLMIQFKLYKKNWQKRKALIWTQLWEGEKVRTKKIYRWITEEWPLRFGVCLGRSYCLSQYHNYQSFFMIFSNWTILPTIIFFAAEPNRIIFKFVVLVSFFRIIFISNMRRWNLINAPVPGTIYTKIKSDCD